MKKLAVLSAAALIGLGAVASTTAEAGPRGGAIAAGVILNLALWFAIHTLFREVVPVRGFGLAFERPVLASVNAWALLLALAAIVAMFRFHAGMVATLAACSAAGVLLHLAGALG